MVAKTRSVVESDSQRKRKRNRKRKRGAAEKWLPVCYKTDMRVAMRASVWRLAKRMAQTGLEDIVGSCGAWFECGGKR